MTHPPPSSYADASDAALIAASRGDADAFRALYDRHVERIYATHLRQARDRDAAHDLTAETFARAWLGRQGFRDESGGSALPWLLGIARNVLHNSVRRRSLEQRACERLGVRERLDSPVAVAEPADTWLDGIDDLLAELPDAHAAALRMRVLEDQDYAAVARRLGTTEQNARVRVHRALKALRTRMTDPKELSR